jgi:hypothetical protein
MIKSRMMSVACSTHERSAYKLLVGKSEGKRPHGRAMQKWEDSIIMDFKGI